MRLNLTRLEIRCQKEIFAENKFRDQVILPKRSSFVFDDEEEILIRLVTLELLQFKMIGSTIRSDNERLGEFQRRKTEPESVVIFLQVGEDNNFR